MRIRTTRQAREIRKGINLARDPRPITTEDIGGHLYQFPLMQRAYNRTRSKPPRGIDGLTRRSHEDGGPITRVANGPILFAPVGTPIDDQSKWQNIGYLHDDGLPLSADDEGRAGWGRPTPTVTHQTFSVSFKGSRVKQARIMRRAFGLYRIPGVDKPLIHKGRKP